MIRIAFYSAGESWEDWEQRLALNLSSFAFVDNEMIHTKDF